MTDSDQYALIEQFTPSLLQRAKLLNRPGCQKTFIAEVGPQPESPHDSPDEDPYFILGFHVAHPGYEAPWWRVLFHITATTVTVGVFFDFQEDSNDSPDWQQTGHFHMTMAELLAYIKSLPAPFQTFITLPVDDGTPSERFVATLQEQWGDSATPLTPAAPSATTPAQRLLDAIWGDQEGTDGTQSTLNDDSAHPPHTHTANQTSDEVKQQRLLRAIFGDSDNSGDSENDGDDDGDGDDMSADVIDLPHRPDPSTDN